MSASLELPYFSRLRARLEGLSAPLIVLRGWPGSGARRFLAWLAQEGGGGVQGLRPADFDQEAPERLRAYTGDLAPRWLVADGVAPERWQASVRELSPHQTLLVASASARAFADAQRTGLGAVGVSPFEFLLSANEIRHLVDPPLSVDDAVALGEASDGWYRVLEILLEYQNDRVLRRAAVAAFIELEVLSEFPPAEVDVLRRAVSEATVRGQEPRQPTWLSGDLVGRLPTVVSDRELVIHDRDGLRLPRPVVSALALAERQQSVGGRGAAGEGAMEAPRQRTRSAPSLEERQGRLAFRLKLLGTPALWRIEGSDRIDLKWPLERSFLMLAFLASRPGLAAGRDELIEALWAGASASEIKKNLHPTVSLLRKTLSKTEPTVILRSGVYRLNPEVDWRIDVLEFERAALLGRPIEGLDVAGSTPDLEAWENAWRSYSGPFLQGFEGRWIEERRDDLQRLYLDTLRGLGEAYFAEGRLTEAEDAFRSVLSADPIQEVVHLAIMRIYADRGRRDLVRKQYERLRGVLAHELGVEPMTSTASSYHRLMS